MTEEEIVFSFVGDMSFGDFPFCQGYGVRSKVKSFGGDYLFSGVKEKFINSDLVFGNLETVLSNKNINEKQLLSVEMRGESHIVKCLKESGFNCINIANNHSLQHGNEAFWDTVSLLEDYDISVVGLHEGRKWNCKPVIMNIKHKTIGILGYAFEYEKYYSGEPCYAFGDSAGIEKDIKLLRPNVDVLIVSCHWGNEFLNYPSREIVKLARSMVDAGVDIVVGHHPHVLQGIESYNNGLIAYSLGNFIFDMLWEKRLVETMILSGNITQNNSVNYKIWPVKINRNYCPELLKNDAKEALEQWIQEISLPIKENICFSINEERYKKEAKIQLNKNRLRAYKYFLRNIYKYKKQYLFQQLKRTFFSKIEDLVKISR